MLAMGVASPHPGTDGGMSIAMALTFGELLRRCRNDAGLTQEELAERAGVSVESISAIERGLTRVPRKDTVQLLADALPLTGEERSRFEAAARQSGRLTTRAGSAPRRSHPSPARYPRHAVARTASALSSARSSISRSRSPVRVASVILTLIALIALGIGVSLLTSRSAASPVGVSAQGAFVPWGSTTAANPDHFKGPAAVAVDIHGNVYVADSGNNRIEKGTSSGDLLAMWGAPSSRSPGLAGPSSLAVYPEGNIVVVDAGRQHIRELSPSGRYVAGLTSQQAYFTATATDAHGAGYTVDLGISSLLKELPHAHSFVRPLQIDLGPIDAPTAVAVDDKGFIYLTAGNDHIWKLSPSGNLLHQWAGEGTASGRFDRPTGIAVDGQGHLFVVDSGNNRIQELSSTTGKSLATWGTRGANSGQFRNPTGIAIDAHGIIYVADTGNNRIQKLSTTGRPLATWTTFQPPPGRFDNVAGITVDGQGNVYVLTGFGDNELYKLSPSGRPLMRVGPSVFLTAPDPHPVFGSGAIVWYVLASVAVDARGNIYVLDAANFRILKLSPTGHVLATWGDWGGTPGGFGFPSGIAVDRRGYVYVVDEGTDRVEKFSSGGKWVTRWGSWGAGQGQFRNPRDVAVDAQGKVYVVDAGNPAEKGSYRVQKFSAEGDFISIWGRRASELNRFPRHPQGAGADAQWLATVARGIATDARGDIYVADTGNNRILELSPTGKPLAHWGTRGTRPGQFNEPTRVAVDGQGNIYVADTGNNRIQKLTRGT